MKRFLRLDCWRAVFRIREVTIYMRIATYARGRKPCVAFLLNDYLVDLKEFAHHSGIRKSFFSSVISLLSAGQDGLETIQTLVDRAQKEDLSRLREARPIASAYLLAPVTRPSKIIALGLNYRDHATEQGIEPPKTPLIFAKFPNSLTGPFDPVVLPPGNPQVDYEGELGVVIGRRGKRISESQALNHVAGYLVFNDISAREWQFSDKQWTRGKSCDSFAPSGPWLTTRDEIPDPHNLIIETQVNDEVRQSSNTNQMIFRIPELIAFISAGITLEPGDLIVTGTPPGVGMFRTPPTFLQPGDVVETQIEGLGRLRNPVRLENPAGTQEVR